MSEQQKPVNKSQASENKFWYTMKAIGKWMYCLRGLLMAIPVGIVAVVLAVRNLAVLPGEVGLFLLSSGDYQWMVAKATAVLLPLLVTALCLLLMFISRRTVYPWLISIFSLVLPILIYITNVFPA